MTCTEERFLSDVANHKMHIARNDGLIRFLKFKAPEGSNCWFEIITWPGRLCINGDHGCYVFSRISDMVEFFRHNETNGPGNPLYINESYWAEKLVSASESFGESKIKGWSTDAFRRHLESGLAEHLKQCIDPENEGLGPEQEDELRADIEDMANAADDDRQHSIAEAYHYDKHGLTFEDAFEWDCTEWDFHFIWCLYAIVWGIRKFDEASDAKSKGSITHETQIS